MQASKDDLEAWLEELGLVDEWCSGAWLPDGKKLSDEAEGDENV